MEMTFDLAIAGGGLAGAAAAIEARRLGLSVAVWERGRFPRDKVCGEFISGESVELLRRLVPAEAARGTEIRNCAFIAPRGRARRFALPKPGLGLSRLVLDHALWRSAISAGACCREAAAVRSVQKVCGPERGRNQTAWQIHSTDGLALTCRHLILACGRWWAIDGLASPARLSETRASPWVGFKAHFSAIATSDAVEIFYFPGGYCGVAAVEAGAVNVCCLVDRDLMKSAGSSEAVRDFRLWLERAARHSALDARLRGGVQASETVAAAPLHLARRAPAADGALLAGDASGFIDPFTGDGMSIALQSGTLAARVFGEAEGRDGGPASQECISRAYGRCLQQSVGRSHGIAGFLRQLVRAPVPVQEFGALALPLVGPALVRATRFSVASGQTAPERHAEAGQRAADC
jgi:flavin-dependent dehydrogenase